MTDALILGGGLAGLSAAHELARREPPLSWTLVEKGERTGGLCRTEERRGFLFDATGHWLHLRDPETAALIRDLLADDLTRITRHSAVYTQNVFLDYPFQVNFAQLPDKRMVADILLAFIDAQVGPGGAERRAREPATFEDFILRHLGAGIAEHFMVPYNVKLWTVHPRELAADWTQRFVPKPTLEQVVRGVLGLDTEPLGYNPTFLYPLRGGIETLPRALAARLDARRIRCGTRPTRIDLERHVVDLDDGTSLPFRRLISTIPLPELVRLCGGQAPAEVREAASRLKATTVTYVNVAARGTGGPPFQWVYFPEPRFRFYRIGSASAAHPALAPAGHRSFYVEFSHRGELRPSEARAEAVAGLLDLGFVAREEDVLFAEPRDIPFAYVIFDAEHGPAKRAITAWLERVGVRSCGRYGSWEYSSMEDAIIAGRTAAREIAMSDER
jgi:protoporphyrinogen oxidase